MEERRRNDDFSIEREAESARNLIYTASEEAKKILALAESNTEVKVLTERVENWMRTTTEYRLSLCAKLDHIQDRLNKLPCDVRCEETKHIKQQLLALWAVTGGMVIAILSEWVKLK